MEVRKGGREREKWGEQREKDEREKRRERSKGY